MSNVRLSRGLCAVVSNALSGSHDALNALFESSGAPGLPPQLPHDRKWKEWLFRAGNDPNVNSLTVLGNVLEEFMDVEPENEYLTEVWKENRERVTKALEENGLRYYRFGRVMPMGQAFEEAQKVGTTNSGIILKPSSVDELLLVLLKGLPRAMHPLTHRRKGSQTLSFSTEYDVQDLLHALLRPWVTDIRPEEFTPSYAGSSTRMDFLLPAYKIVLELKYVRDSKHAKKIGDELIIDIDHYVGHPDCKILWCVIFDPNHLLENPGGLKQDLEGTKTTKHGTLQVKVIVLQLG